MKDINRGQVLAGFFWRFFERCGDQVLRFVVSIILARLLEPSTFGSIALVMVFITILNVFIDSGFGSALIQKKHIDQLDYSTVFYFNIIMCGCLYMLMFLCSPLIANFYDNQELLPVIRVLSLTIIISGFKNVQQSYVARNLLYRKLFIVNISSSALGAIIGITLAFCGYGIWALVWQQISSLFISTLLLWIVVAWRPNLMFSFLRLKNFFNYGWKLLIVSLLDTIYSQFNQLIIGKVYTSEDLAFYNRGSMFPATIVDNINTATISVLFPTISSVQDNIDKVRTITRGSIKTSVYFIAPLLMLLASSSDTLIPLLLSDKWLPCVIFVKIFCISYLFYPIYTINLIAIKSLGRSDLFLKLEIIRKIIGIAGILLTIWISVEALALSVLSTNFLSQIISSYSNKKYINYSFKQQLNDTFPVILLAIFMGLCIYFINFVHIYSILILIIQFIVGTIIYILGSIILKLDSYLYMKSNLKNIINTKIFHKKY